MEGNLSLALELEPALLIEKRYHIIQPTHPDASKSCDGFHEQTKT